MTASATSGPARVFSDVRATLAATWTSESYARSIACSSPTLSTSE